MNMYCYVRLLNINVKNLKNLKDGTIIFDSNKKVMNGNFDFNEADIVGIYGQNGSSKSTIINAFTILNTILLNKSITNDKYDYISCDEDYSIINVSFYHRNNNEHYIYDYIVKLYKDKENHKCALYSEEISVKKFNEGKWTKINTIFEINKDSQDIVKFITPKTNVDVLTKNNKNIFPQLLILKGQKEESNSSFIFSNEFENILRGAKSFIELADFIHQSKIYAMHYLHLYDNREISKIVALDTIPFFFKNETDTQVSSLQGNLSLFNDGVVKKVFEQTIREYIKEINLVLSAVVPGTQVELLNLGDTVDEQGEPCFKYELVSVKEKFNIPLSFESDGIKKIISIVSSLVDAFNNPYAILIIDEFDSGIFEYLLGMILKVFKAKGKGQLLFTSHNLRALEVVKDDIVFSTTNDVNKFIKMSYVGQTNNLRKKYLRDMYMGEEDLIKPIDEYDIYRALEAAGDLYLNGKEKK